jgi:hypothetical protein
MTSWSEGRDEDERALACTVPVGLSSSAFRPVDSDSNTFSIIVSWQSYGIYGKSTSYFCPPTVRDRCGMVSRSSRRESRAYRQSKGRSRDSTARRDRAWRSHEPSRAPGCVLTVPQISGHWF